MIFDVIALIFVLIVTFIMMKKGGIKAIVSLLGLVLSLVIAYNIYPVLSESAYKTAFPEMIETNITKVLSEGYENISWESIDAMPEFIQNGVKFQADTKAEGISQAVSQAVTKVIVDILVFLTVVIATKLIFAILVKLLDLVAKLPVIKQFNALTGAMCGLCISLVIVWLSVAFLGVVGTSNADINKITKDSYTVEIMSNITPF